MVRLIEALLPRFLHRIALRIAYQLRRRWRMIRKVPLVGVAMIVRNDRGQVLLVRHSYGPPMWSLPGGGAKRGEEPIAVAVRELQEELNCIGTQPKLVGSFEEVLSGSPHTAHLVELTVNGPITPDRREVNEAVFFEPDALPHDINPHAEERLRYWQSQQR